MKVRGKYWAQKTFWAQYGKFRNNRCAFQLQQYCSYSFIPPTVPVRLQCYAAEANEVRSDRIRRRDQRVLPSSPYMRVIVQAVFVQPFVAMLRIAP